MRREVPRVSAEASAVEAAEAAGASAAALREASGAAAGGSGAMCCVLVVNPEDGALVGVATGASLARALETMTSAGGERRRRVLSAAEACDPRVPLVTSSATLLDAWKTMDTGLGGAGLAVVVAGSTRGGSGDWGGGAGEGRGDDGSVRGGARGVMALGVLEARAVEAERDAGTLHAALRAFRCSVSDDGGGGGGGGSGSGGGGDAPPSTPIQPLDSSAPLRGGTR